MRGRLVLATVILLAVVTEVLSMTITDPKIYSKPWTGQLKRFRLLPQKRGQDYRRMGRPV